MAPISARSAQAQDPEHFRLRAVRQVDFLVDLDAVEQASGLFLAQDRRLAAVDNVLRPTHRMRRVDGEHLTDDESGAAVGR
jgi:hypothetical protein